MKKDLKKYEIGFWVISEQGRENILTALKNQRTKIVDEGNLTKMRLAYPIKKTTLALFGFIHFLAEPAAIKKIKDAIALDNEILRSIIVFPVITPLRKSHDEFSSRSPLPSSVATSAASSTAIRKEIRKPKSVILSNEDLEKKLEEMLK